jgi:hypothetical protein
MSVNQYAIRFSSRVSQFLKPVTAVAVRSGAKVG